jgi:hypothetical protein
MTPRVLVPWIGAGALFLASCGPSKDTCIECGMFAFSISARAHQAGLDEAGICGDAETGKGTQPGFESDCDHLRSSCGFSPGVCNSNGRLWAGFVTGGTP